MKTKTKKNKPKAIKAKPITEGLIRRDLINWIVDWSLQNTSNSKPEAIADYLLDGLETWNWACERWKRHPIKGKEAK